MKAYLKIGAVALGMFGGVGGVWAAGEHFGFRPAFKLEVDTIQSEIQVVAKSVEWLRLENFERRIDRGQKLTRRECGEYRSLAKRLNVDPKKC